VPIVYTAAGSGPPPQYTKRNAPLSRWLIPLSQVTRSQLFPLPDRLANGTESQKSIVGHLGRSRIYSRSAAFKSTARPIVAVT
jgi:hypothetical protein